MIRLFLLLVIIGAAMVCGPLLAGNKGYVLIAIGDYTIEMTVISAGILALLLYGVLWCTERLLLRLFHIKGSTRRWFTERRRRKARERTLAGTLALAEGQFQQAETLMRKSAPDSDQALLNYLSAAEAAQAQGQTERRDAYLQQAAEQHPRASLAVSLIRARLLLRQKQYSEAETLLQSLDQAHPQHAVIQQLLKECYLALGHWSQLLALLPQLSKRKQLSADELQQLQQQIYPPLFTERAASAGRDGVMALWQELPRALRQDATTQAAAAMALIGLGDEVQAQEILLEGVRRSLSPSLLAVVPQLQQPAPKLLAQLQKSEQSAEPSADLLQAIGILLLRQREMEQAQAYLERAVALQPQATAYRALAELMEQQRLFEKANFYYRQSSAV
ncbi:MAG: heme biosynthesis protein HemY [Aeromonadaceae bacterium]|nr:heme biosynthesis protein HemY [Aeromonadaceae bacterium]